MTHILNHGEEEVASFAVIVDNEAFFLPCHIMFSAVELLLSLRRQTADLFKAQL